MNHPIAQFVALTCYATAALLGRTVPDFFPRNSTCRFCDSVEFVRPARHGLVDVPTGRVANTPDAWFGHLKATAVSGVRLSRALSGFPKLASIVAFVEAWNMEAVQRDGRSARWTSRWEVWNQKAPKRRIWRVCYSRGVEQRASASSATPLAPLVDGLRLVLGDIHGFAKRNKLGGFTDSFARAIETIDSRGQKLHGYHRDLAPEGCLPALATCLLDACQSAWVFGGMGSWNDLGFHGTAQAEYTQVTKRLRFTVCEVIEAAANASFLLT
jgi:hypothetical protein